MANSRLARGGTTPNGFLQLNCHLTIPFSLASLPPALALLVDSISLYRHHAVYNISTEFHFFCADRTSETDLIVIHKVHPRQHMPQQRRVSAIPRRHTLHVRRELAVTVERFPFLDLIHHLPHIHLNLAFILRPTVEPH